MKIFSFLLLLGVFFSITSFANPAPQDLQQSFITLNGSATTTYKGFAKYLYSAPIPFDQVSLASLEGRVSIETSTPGDFPSEALFSIWYLPSNQCLPDGSMFLDYPTLSKSVPGSISIASFIVKNFGAGSSVVDTNVEFPRPLPIKGCVYIILDGGPSIGKGVDSVIMKGQVKLNYTNNVSAPPHLLSFDDEYCFGWPGGCQRSTLKGDATFATVVPVKKSGTLLLLYGDVSAGSLSASKGLWSVQNDFYLEPHCSGLSPKSRNNGPFKVAVVPKNAISLLSFNRQTSKNLLQEKVYQPLSIHVNADDCIVHQVQSRGALHGVDAEEQVKAVVMPDELN